MMTVNLHRLARVSVNQADRAVWLIVETDNGDRANLFFTDPAELHSFALAVLRAAARPGSPFDVVERMGGREESAPAPAPAGGLPA